LGGGTLVLTPPGLASVTVVGDALGQTRLLGTAVVGTHISSLFPFFLFSTVQNCEGGFVGVEPARRFEGDEALRVDFDLKCRESALVRHRDPHPSYFSRRLTLFSKSCLLFLNSSKGGVTLPIFFFF